MCTAISFHAGNHYFGRNLDLEYCYQEAVTITPRNYPFPFRYQEDMPSHFAFIGMATIADGFPLYYDGTNEAGLSVAGLNFPGNVYYFPPQNNESDLAPFELIPWLLCQCKTVEEVRKKLHNKRIAKISFSEQYPVSDLHWMASDHQSSVTIEPTEKGLQIYDNPIEVLTNNPPFPFHLAHLGNYLQLSPFDPENSFLPSIPLTPYSRGMGAMGLPGDFSSSSRFIRASFVKEHSAKPESEGASVCQFFHILQSAAQPEGCVYVDGKPEKTVYSSCCNTKDGIYYYTTYENSSIHATGLHNENLSGTSLISYPLRKITQIIWENHGNRHT